MKTLLLIRHAKSSWANPDENDFDRSLNDRGKADAPLMAARIYNKKIPVDAFITSPAKRARKTCEYFIQQYKRSSEEIILKPELYLAGFSVFFHVIEQMNNNINHASVFLHNNGITDFVNQLTDVRIDNMPTCSVFAIKIHTNSWKGFKQAKKEFLFFDYPKKG